jgi:hypothetical protein
MDVAVHFLSSEEFHARKGTRSTRAIAIEAKLVAQLTASDFLDGVGVTAELEVVSAAGGPDEADVWWPISPSDPVIGAADGLVVAPVFEAVAPEEDSVGASLELVSDTELVVPVTGAFVVLGVVVVDVREFGPPVEDAIGAVEETEDWLFATRPITLLVSSI